MSPSTDIQVDRRWTEMAVGQVFDVTDRFKNYESFKVSVNQFARRAGQRMTVSKMSGRFLVKREM